MFYELLDPPGLLSVRVIPIEYDPTVLAPVGLKEMEVDVAIAKGTEEPRVIETIH